MIAKSKDKQFTTEITQPDSPHIRTVYAGLPVESGGLGTDFRPSQLLLAGYIGCLNMTLQQLLIDDGITFENVTVSADINTKEEGINKIYTKIEIDADLPEETKQVFIEKAKNCYVKTLLTNETQFFDMP